MEQQQKKAERFRAALVLAERSAEGFRRTANRYSLCGPDAEDAYQRGLEILLTKAPTSDPEQLRPWLHTVIKHEALALRSQRERLLGAELTNAGTAGGPDELAPERERARHTAEALRGLKQSEIQCMLLKALGYSYDEIAARTGYSWTKVNRSLSEGRKQFFERLDEIRSGAACDRLEPRIAIASREAIPVAERQGLDAHLAGCASCRARLRELRAAPGLPSRLPSLQLLTPVALLAALRGRGWPYDRVAGLLDRLGPLTELVGAHKVAAVAASTAALAGGMAADVELRSSRTQHPPMELSASTRATNESHRAVAQAPPQKSVSGAREVDGGVVRAPARLVDRGPVGAEFELGDDRSSAAAASSPGGERPVEQDRASPRAPVREHAPKQPPVRGTSSSGGEEFQP